MNNLKTKILTACLYFLSFAYIFKSYDHIYIRYNICDKNILTKIGLTSLNSLT